MALTRRSCTIFLLVTACPLLSNLTAQSPADRHILTSLDAAFTSGALPKLDPAADAESRNLQAGLDELAEWVHDGDMQPLQRALFRFNTASIRRDSWGWPDYALARALILMHIDSVPLRPLKGVRDGELYLEAAWRHLDEALSRDPDLLPARKFLVSLALPSGDRQLRATTRTDIANEVARPDPLPGALVVWARDLRFKQQFDSALATIKRAEELGFDQSTLSLERARLLAAKDDLASAEKAYWEGIPVMSRAGREFYRQDLGYILLSDSLTIFDSVPDNEVGTWLQHFWAERDAAIAEAPGTRLREHLRRWVYAFKYYRVTRPWRTNYFTRVDYAFDDIRAQCVGSVPDFYNRLPIHPPSLSGDPRAGEALLDHRGLIYLKHGDPFGRSTPGPEDPSAPPSTEAQGSDVAQPKPDDLPPIPEGQTGALQQESLTRVEIWVYWIEGAWRVLIFRGSKALGLNAATTLSSYLPPGSVGAWLALAAILPQYRGAADMALNYHGVLDKHCLPQIAEAIVHQRKDADVGIDTDSDTPPIADPWNAEIRFFGLGHGNDHSGRALVTFALPFNRVHADTLPGGQLQLRTRFRIVAYRPSDGARIDLDSTRTFHAAAAAPSDAFLTGWFELPLEPGSWQIAVRAGQPGDSLDHIYALRRTLEIAGTPTLALSDVVTGTSGTSPWRAPDGPFPVNALGTWQTKGTAKLWYQVQGLKAGDSYTTTIAVSPTGGQKGRIITVTTTDRASGPVTTIRRDLSLERLKPGNYLLTVTIAADSHSASREQELVIVE